MAQRTDPFLELVELLVAEGTLLFRQLQAKYSQERFYGFGLIAPAHYTYLFPCANSEEGLLRCAQQELSYCPNMTLAQVAQAMRWQTNGWDYTCSSDSIPQVQAWHKQRVEFYWHINWGEYDNYVGDDFYGLNTWCQRMYASLEEALRRIGQQLFPDQPFKLMFDFDNPASLHAVGVESSA